MQNWDPAPLKKRHEQLIRLLHGTTEISSIHLWQPKIFSSQKLKVNLFKSYQLRENYFWIGLSAIEIEAGLNLFRRDYGLVPWTSNTGVFALALLDYKMDKNIVL